MTQRGEIWEVRFDPSEGDEIKKIRPAVVLSKADAGRMSLRIVVPITGWQSHFTGYFWMVKLDPTPANGLTKASSADTVQVKSLSTTRFIRKIGQASDDEMKRIVAGVVVCVGYMPTK
jgi:mRNA interferase MazF